MSIILLVSKEDSIKLDTVGAVGSWETGYERNYLHFTDAGVHFTNCCKVGDNSLWIDHVLKKSAISANGYNHLQNSLFEKWNTEAKQSK